MTDYYLRDAHCYADTITGRLNAAEKAAGLPLAVVRLMGMHQTVYELVTECDWIPEGTMWPNPFELSEAERKELDEAYDRWVDHQLNQKSRIVVGVDHASLDGDRNAVVVGKHTGDQFVLTDAAELNPGQYVVDIDEEGKLKLSSASMGQVHAGVLKFKHPDGSRSEVDFTEGEIRFHDTPGHEKLDDEEASKVAAIKERGRSFIELIESCRRQIKMPDYDRPSIVHFASDPHDHSLTNALDRAEEAIMWAVKYITAGE